jgi:chaperonin GroES
MSSHAARLDVSHVLDQRSRTQRMSILQIQEGVVVAAGPGLRTKEGNVLPMSLKEGDKVLLPNYGGTEVKIDDKEFLIFNEDEILAKLE